MLKTSMNIDSPTEVSAAGMTYYIDSVNGLDSNNGTSASIPWRTLAKVSGTTFVPGDRILLCKGRVWDEDLILHGSGNATSAITLGSYGTGDMPVVNGTGGLRAVWLDGVSYWDIQNIEITNDGAAEAKRSGIEISAGAGLGTLNSIHLSNLNIHNVKGLSHRTPNVDNMYTNSAIFIRIDTANGTNDTKFNDLKVENCNIHDITTSGMFFLAPDTYNFTPSKWHTDVIIRNNTISRTGSDPLIVGYCDTPLIEYNVATDGGVNGVNFQYIAGMWSYHVKDAIFQFNECSGTRLDVGDGMAWDYDWGTCGTSIYQYNYSHNNQGGILTDVCANGYDFSGSLTFNSIFRYNISQNDRTGRIAIERNDLTAYNNVIYNPYGSILIEPGTGGNKFYNNIFVASTADLASENTYEHNCYFGGLVPPDDLNKVTCDPGFVNPGSGGSGLESVSGYQLRPDSPLLNKGEFISNNGGRDYWGNALYYGAPDIGAFEYQSTAQAPVYIMAINDNDSKIVYSGKWIYETARGIGDYGDDAHYTETDNAYFECRFKGTAVELVSEKDSSLGDVDVYIDNVFEQTVNCYNATRLVQQVVFGKTGLAAGTHIIKCVKKSGTYFFFDALKVYSSISPVR